MKIRAFAIGLLAASSLVACQAEQETGTGQDNYEGVQNTRFQRMADNMYEEGNRANRYDNDRGMVHNTNYHVAKDAAVNIEKNVKGVDEAYVLKTRDNAYVAAVMDNNSGEESMTDKVEEGITKAVKNTDQDINNVYVSTNPDFIDLTNNYVNDVENGEPVRGFFQEFGQMVDRVFPEAK
ncbi:sporulation lipoprotein, YhcN/YlaJ family [Halobacillus alkaliphilus]|uniref:Sporulation lipoprotein, YhcN/YlaJ family n=1 Tax=Halobacillus alkaliphilus TaxID=396056 RepID=A0A1I2RRJ1_9BACI|nr:YhcN/YlaJ family sporulation lipoprotein [Halobacillus alkaliphilus]SFG43138.1 sporulation lipoprotein, YhcN/YlaJ family [Halobacillus alkaliphilus]